MYAVASPAEIARAGQATPLLARLASGAARCDDEIRRLDFTAAQQTREFLAERLVGLKLWV